MPKKIFGTTRFEASNQKGRKGEGNGVALAGFPAPHPNRALATSGFSLVVCLKQTLVVRTGSIKFDMLLRKACPLEQQTSFREDFSFHEIIQKRS